jgi:hypothetical protein
MTRAIAVHTVDNLNFNRVAVHSVDTFRAGSTKLWEGRTSFVGEATSDEGIAGHALVNLHLNRGAVHSVDTFRASDALRSRLSVHSVDSTQFGLTFSTYSCSRGLRRAVFAMPQSKSWPVQNRTIALSVV